MMMNPNEAPDTSLLPRNSATGEPLPPTPQPGYYPGFSTMSQKNFWDDATRKVVTMRVEQPPPIRYFTPEQASFWRAVFDHLIPQHDRTPERRIPLVEPLDERLYRNRGVGYRYESMPPDREAFQLGEEAINAESRESYKGDFVDLPHRQQELVLKAIHDGKPAAAKEIWKQMSVSALLATAHAGRARSLLLAPLGVGRDRLRRPGVPSRLHAVRARRARTLGGRGATVRVGRAEICGLRRHRGDAPPPYRIQPE